MKHISGMEPALGGEPASGLTGMEPALGGALRAPVDSRLWQALLSRQYRRIRRAVQQVKQRQQARHYTHMLELVVRDEEVYGRRKFSTRERRSAVEAVALLGEPGALSPLLDALDDESWEIRQYAAWALGEFGDYLAVDALLGALQDPHPLVQGVAADALRRFVSTRARKALDARQKLT